MSYFVDGAEAKLSTSALESLTYDDLKSLTKRRSIKTPDHRCGESYPVFKIVRNSKWYLVYYIDNEKAEIEREKIAVDREKLSLDQRKLETDEKTSDERIKMDQQKLELDKEIHELDKEKVEHEKTANEKRQKGELVKVISENGSRLVVAGLGLTGTCLAIYADRNGWFLSKTGLQINPKLMIK